MAGDGEVGSEEQANQVISGVAERVMRSIFGRKSFDSILQVLRDRYGLDLDEMPDKPRLFL